MCRRLITLNYYYFISLPPLSGVLEVRGTRKSPTDNREHAHRECMAPPSYYLYCCRLTGGSGCTLAQCRGRR